MPIKTFETIIHNIQTTDTVITLTGISLSDAQIIQLCEVLAACPHVTYAYLNHCNINDTGVKQLASNTTLTHLDLANNNISDLGASAFLHNQTLQALNLENNGLSTDIIQRLEYHKPFVTLDSKKNIAYASWSTALLSWIENPSEYLCSPRTRPSADLRWLAFFPGVSPLSVRPDPIENASPHTTSERKKNN
ncbi:MAG: hypothetical protein P1U61_06625 [Legionellaceae bacterium]|nr:hypothetical protein [Legionellaceae bacterium]